MTINSSEEMEQETLLVYRLLYSLSIIVQNWHIESKPTVVVEIK